MHGSIDWLRDFDKRPRRTFARSPRAVPWENALPWAIVMISQTAVADDRGPRVCLRKGCGRKYQPRRWNQRYCQDPECLRLVRRWQAAKRQAKRRQDEAAKAQHAEAERVRRQRVPSSPQPPQAASELRRRVVTQQKFFRPLPCATGRGAMSRLRSRAAARHATAAPPAVRPFAGSWIANASGSSVALSEAAGHASRSTRPPGRGVADSNPTPSARQPHRRRLRDRGAPAAPVGRR